MKIANEVKKRSNARAGGKTAFVFTKDIGYGLGRMFETFSEIKSIQLEFKNFRSIADAKEWLGV